MNKITKKIGLLSCCAIVAGNMMGSGIALLPANLAAIGSIATISWLIAIVGAIGLAYLFAVLGTVNPQEGGLVAYAGEVSPILGHQTGVLYFHANWIGNLAIGITAVSYLTVFFPTLNSPIPAGITTIVIVWVFAALNLLGASWIARLTTIGVIALLIPVILTATFGWVFFKPELFTANWNVTGTPNYHAIVGGVLLCIWSFIGVESAAVDANLVQNPKRTIPISTIVGTVIAAMVYLFSSTAIIGMFPATEIAHSGAPFALAMVNMLHYPLAGQIVSAITAFACLTSLSSWIMLVAQAGARAAHDGNLPKIFGRLSRKDIPAVGIVLTACFMTALMLGLMLLKGNSQEIFGEVISIAVLMTILPYYYSALNLIRIAEHRKRAFFQLAAGFIAVGFCFLGLFGASKTAIMVTMVFSLVTFVFYVTKDRSKYEQQMRKEAREIK
jgi:cadaverine:lysine antiporter